MAMFKRLLPEDQAEQSSRSPTVFVFFYFWFIGIVLLLVAGYGFYERVRGTQEVPVFKIIFALIYSLFFIIGAWLIGRFDRNGVILIAVGVLASMVSWISGLPGKSDIIFTLVTIIALIKAWQELSSSPLRNSRGD